MAIELTSSEKAVITNTVTVKRNAKGMSLTIFAPEIHAWLKEQGEYQNIGTPRTGWPREGKFLCIPDSVDGDYPRCMQNYNTDYIWLGSGQQEVNLAILRHEDAATKAVTVTYPGVWPFEDAQRLLMTTQEAIAKFYRETMREYSGTATIKIAR
jgi:hypothetical protein